MTARTDRPWLRFVAGFAQDLAREIDERAAPREYVPTQIVTEYVRYHLPTADGHPIDAIRYWSAADVNRGVCWVVFADQDNCGVAIADSHRLLGLDPVSISRHRVPATTT